MGTQERSIAALALGVPIEIHHAQRARRLVLSVGPTGRVRLSTPPGIDTAEICRFLESRQGWLEARRAAVPEPVPFEPGAVVPQRSDGETIEPSVLHCG